MSENAEDFVTKWTCDICQVATFDTYEEAVEHENACQKPKEKMNSYFTVWTCDVCKVAEFPTFEEAEAHEKNCVLKTETANESDEEDEDEPQQKDCFVCDICEEALFETFEDALEHEKTCDGKKGGKHSKGQITLQAGEKLGEKFESKPSKEDKEKIKSAKPPEKDKISKKIPSSNSPLVLPERKCKGYDDSSSSVTKFNKKIAQAQKRKNKKIIEEAIDLSLAYELKDLPPLTTFQPIIRTYQDTPDFFKLSAFNAAIMSAVDLYESRIPVEGTFKSFRAVYFRCTYCKQEWPYEWTIQKMGTYLPNLLITHLTCTCTNIPETKKSFLRTLQPYADVGKKKISIFLSDFCKENGIVEGIVSLEPTKVVQLVLTSPPLWKITSWKCRRLSAMSSEEKLILDDTSTTEDSDVLAVYSPSKNSKPFASSVTAPPLSKDKDLTEIKDTSTGRNCVTKTSFPMKFPESLAMYQNLSPFNQVAIAQLEFAIEDRNDINYCPLGYRRLMIRCKHCGNFSRLTYTDTWHKIIYSMTYSHLSKSCSQIPNQIRLRLANYLGKKKSYHATGPTVGLKQYCRFVANFYGFVDLKPEFYCTPGIAAYFNPLGKSKEFSKKRKSNSPATSGEESQAKRNKVPSPELKKGQYVSPSGVLFTADDGISIYLPRAGGVPLLSSLCKNQSAKLSPFDKLLLDNLELCEERKQNSQQLSTKAIEHRLAIRCQNCKSIPGLSHTLFLDTKENWYKTVASCRGHLETCLYTPESIRDEITNSATKSSMKGSISLKNYCNYLTNLFGMINKNDKSDGGSGVAWGDCEYILSEYDSEPIDVERVNNMKKTHLGIHKRSVPSHDLMLPVPQSINVHPSSKRMTATAKNLSRIVLTDYNYLIVAQLELFALGEKTQNRSRPGLRHRTSLTPKSSPPQESISKKAVLEIVPRCIHCGYTRLMYSIEDFATNGPKMFSLHLESCPLIPNYLIEKMAECKSLHSIQDAAVGIVPLKEYIRMLMIDVYEMSDIESRRFTSGGVSMNRNSQEIIAEYGKIMDATKHKTGTEKDLTSGSFLLPLLLDNKVQAVSSAIESLAVLTSKMKTAKTLTCRSKDLSAEESCENGEREVKATMSEIVQPKFADNASSKKIGIEKEDAKDKSIGGNESEE